MSDYRSGRYEREAAERAPSVAETIELGVRRLATAIVIAGGLVGIGVYAGSDGDEAPRYQVTAADGRIVRVNTESGTVIACQERRCAIVLQRGQDLEEEPSPPPEIQAQHNAAAALPAPAAAPTAPAAPQPARR